MRSLAAVGDGMPDLLVGTAARNYLFEVKDPSQVKSKRVLTGEQKEFFATWKGQVRKIEHVDEILTVIRESYGR